MGHMTREDIIRMAREAGFELTKNQHGNIQFRCFSRELERFAALVAAAEREACAVIAFNADTYIQAAAAIRARGQE